MTVQKPKRAPRQRRAKNPKRWDVPTTTAHVNVLEDDLLHRLGRRAIRDLSVEGAKLEDLAEGIDALESDGGLEVAAILREAYAEREAKLHERIDAVINAKYGSSGKTRPDEEPK